MLGPEDSITAEVSTDYPNWARILIQVKCVETRRCGFVPERTGNSGSLSRNAVLTHISTPHERVFA